MKLKKKPARVIFVVVFMLCLALLTGLGGWQLNRGLEKKAVEMRIANGGTKVNIVSQKPANWDDLAYTKVELQGQWLKQYFLLDNRIHRHQPGYELIVPFRLDGDQSVILGNLGWLAKSRIETDMPSADDIEDFAADSGQLYIPQKGFTLGPAYSDAKSWPRIIQYIDLEQLGDALQLAMEPATVVMNDNPELGTVRIWQPYTMDANRHYGYATQWWGLALVLVVFGIIWYKRA